MPGAAEFMYYGPNAAQEGLAAAEKFNTPGAAAYGSVPSAPTVQPTAAAATAGAIGAGNAVYNQLPGYSGSLANIGQNIQSETAGQLPADVLTQLQQGAAERGIATGTPGSANSGADYLRSLGLTSLNLTQQGQQNFQSILPELPGAGIAANPNFYVTPEQQYEAALQASVFQSAPQPAAAAAARLAAAGGGIGAGLGLAGGRGPAAGVTPTSIPEAGQTGPYGPADTNNNVPMLNDLIGQYDPNAGYDPMKPYDTDPSGDTNTVPGSSYMGQ